MVEEHPSCMVTIRVYLATSIVLVVSGLALPNREESNDETAFGATSLFRVTVTRFMACYTFKVLLKTLRLLLVTYDHILGYCSFALTHQQTWGPSTTKERDVSGLHRSRGLASLQECAG